MFGKPPRYRYCWYLGCIPSKSSSEIVAGRQQPMATPQMGLLRVDMIRSGLRKIPAAKRNHLYYIMPQ